MAIRARRFLNLLFIVLIMLTASLGVFPTTVKAADEFVRDSNAENLFKQVWDKADGPIVAQKASRSWLWGPNAFLLAREDYDEAPGGTRYIAYFDKARMELTRPATGQVTNGLLVVEMMTGKFQDGDARYVPSPDGPATINIVGDTGNWLTYAKLAPFASLNNDNKAADRTGQTADQELTQTGSVQSGRAGQQSLIFYESTLGHNVPKVFWDYLNQTGTVYNATIKNYSQGQPINWLSDAGYPITEPYWVRQKVAGVEKDVLVQAFQRRTITFTPDNPPAYQVEMGNVGRHYTKWGYKQDFGNPPALSAPEVAAAPPTPPVATPPPPSTPNPPASRPVTSDSSPCLEGQIKGNRNSGIYHVPGQRDYAKTKANVACFDTEAEAIQAGYRKALR